jgi:hypothetical protein
MADKKISALTAASLPLAGTEVLPIVQSGATVKVATDDLTVKNIRSNATSGLLQVTGPGAGTTRVMTTPNANFTAARTDAAQSFTGDQTLSTGNLVIGTSGKGVDFSATSHPSGMLSELLDDYEEGTWTPTLTTDGTDFGSVTYGGQNGGRYVKVGKTVFVHGTLNVSAVTKGSASSNVMIGGLPYASMTGGLGGPAFSAGTVASTSGWTTNAPMIMQTEYGGSRIYLNKVDTAGATSQILVANVSTGSNVVGFAMTYQVD